VYEGRILVEGIALIPYDSDRAAIDSENILLAQNNIHLALLEFNRPKLCYTISRGIE
jgi:hypothetical protein